MPSTLASGTRTIVARLKRIPWIRRWRDRRHIKLFHSKRSYGAHYGVFGDFAEARDWLPPSEGFHHGGFADEYVEVRTKRVFAYDYPVMFWLREAFSLGALQVLDIGGSVGVHYYAYRQRLSYPSALQWCVQELPNAVSIGRELAREQQADNLNFIETLDPATLTADIWISAGTLEFIEDFRLGALLSSCRCKPGHILLNKLPLHDKPDMVSTQNIGGGAFAPHHVYNRAKFVAEIERAGYELVDSWEVPERSFFMPGHPDKSFDCYSGLYFRAVRA